MNSNGLNKQAECLTLIRKTNKTKHISIKVWNVDVTYEI